MKRYLFILLSICIMLPMAAQPTFLKKNNLKDFSSKTTKIVLAGNNSLLDLVLKDAVESNWFLSPYEICDMEDFDKLKTDSTYYFLIHVDGRYGTSEAGSTMEFLTLVKGGPEAADGLNSMPEIISLPLQDTDDNSGRIFSYIPAYIRIIQTHVLKVMENVLSAYVGASSYTGNALDKAKGKTILFGKDDFAFDITQEELDRQFQGKAKLATSSEIDNALAENAAGTLVSLIVSPISRQKGFYCFKMLISADTKELYMYRRHKISSRNKAGFLKEDYKRIAVPFSF